MALTVTGALGSLDIHIYDFARNDLTQLTFTGSNCCPMWMPDGERVVFTSARDRGFNLYWRNVDGTGEAERLTEGPEIKSSHDVTRDGLTVVFTTGPGDVHTLSLDDLTTNQLVETEFHEGRPRLSPDGQWIAYETDESGEFKVLVRPFPDIEGGRWEVTIDGGHSPLWSLDGRELFYYSDGTMWAVLSRAEQN